MKRFSVYVEEADEVAAQPGGDGIEAAMKVAMQKHRGEVERFLNRLAERDPDVKDAMNGAGGGDDGPVTPDDMKQSKDDVTPPEADGSPGMDGGDQGGGY